MGVLKNDVGRPSNKTIKTRRVLIIIAVVIAVVALLSLGIWLEKKSSNDNTSNKNEEIITTTTTKPSIEESKKEENISNVSNLKECKIQKINVEGKSEGERIYNRLTSGFLGSDFQFTDKKYITSSSLNTYTKVSQALYNLGFFEQSYNIPEEGCILKNEVIKNQVSDMYKDASYNPKDFIGNDCMELSFTYNENIDSYVVKKISAGCGDAGTMHDAYLSSKINGNNLIINSEALMIGPDNFICFYNDKDELDSVNLDGVGYDTPIDAVIKKSEPYKNKYEWLFVKNSNGKYVFDSVTRVK